MMQRKSKRAMQKTKITHGQEEEGEEGEEGVFPPGKTVKGREVKSEERRAKRARERQEERLD